MFKNHPAVFTFYWTVVFSLFSLASAGEFTFETSRISTHDFQKKLRKELLTIQSETLKVDGHSLMGVARYRHEEAFTTRTDRSLAFVINRKNGMVDLLNATYATNEGSANGLAFDIFQATSSQVGIETGDSSNISNAPTCLYLWDMEKSEVVLETWHWTRLAPLAHHVYAHVDSMHYFRSTDQNDGLGYLQIAIDKTSRRVSLFDEGFSRGGVFSAGQYVTPVTGADDVAIGFIITAGEVGESNLPAADRSSQKFQEFYDLSGNSRWKTSIDQLDKISRFKLVRIWIPMQPLIDDEVVVLAEDVNADMYYALIDKMTGHSVSHGQLFIPHKDIRNALASSKYNRLWVDYSEVELWDQTGSRLSAVKSSHRTSCFGNGLEIITVGGGFDDELLSVEPRWTYARNVLRRQ